MVKVQPGELFNAAREGDVDKVRDILNRKDENINNIDYINDVDPWGKTALMVAARGGGHGGEEYGEIIKLLWNAYKQAVTKPTLKTILLQTDNQNQDFCYEQKGICLRYTIQDNWMAERQNDC